MKQKSGEKKIEKNSILFQNIAIIKFKQNKSYAPIKLSITLGKSYFLFCFVLFIIISNYFLIPSVRNIVDTK